MSSAAADGGIEMDRQRGFRTECGPNGRSSHGLRDESAGRGAADGTVFAA
jgi:hypothetical protein